MGKKYTKRGSETYPKVQEFVWTISTKMITLDIFPSTEGEPHIIVSIANNLKD